MILDYQKETCDNEIDPRYFGVRGKDVGSNSIKFGRSEQCAGAGQASELWLVQEPLARVHTPLGFLGMVGKHCLGLPLESGCESLRGRHICSVPSPALL